MLGFTDLVNETNDIEENTMNRQDDVTVSRRRLKEKESKG